jgi:hypothetical protein
VLASSTLPGTGHGQELSQTGAPAEAPPPWLALLGLALLVGLLVTGKLLERTDRTHRS